MNIELIKKLKKETLEDLVFNQYKKIEELEQFKKSVKPQKTCARCGCGFGNLCHKCEEAILPNGGNK